MSYVLLWLHFSNLHPFFLSPTNPCTYHDGLNSSDWHVAFNYPSPSPVKFSGNPTFFSFLFLFPCTFQQYVHIDHNIYTLDGGLHTQRWNNKGWKMSSMSSLSSLPLLLNLETFWLCYCRISNKLNITCWVFSSNHHRLSIINLFTMSFPSLLFMLKLLHPHQLQYH